MKCTSMIQIKSFLQVKQKLGHLIIASRGKWGKIEKKINNLRQNSASSSLEFLSIIITRLSIQQLIYISMLLLSIQIFLWRYSIFPIQSRLASWQKKISRSQKNAADFLKYMLASRLAIELRIVYFTDPLEIDLLSTSFYDLEPEGT